MTPLGLPGADPGRSERCRDEVTSEFAAAAEAVWQRNVERNVWTDRTGPPAPDGVPRRVCALPPLRDRGGSHRGRQKTRLGDHRDPPCGGMSDDRPARLHLPAAGGDEASAVRPCPRWGCALWSLAPGAGGRALTKGVSPGQGCCPRTRGLRRPLPPLAGGRVGTSLPRPSGLQDHTEVSLGPAGPGTSITAGDRSSPSLRFPPVPRGH